MDNRNNITSNNERIEKNMEEWEAFINELYEIAQKFKPIYNHEWKKVVYFKTEKKNWLVQKVEFRDKREDGIYDRNDFEAKNNLSGLTFQRSDDYSFFSLSTYWPIHKIDNWSWIIHHSQYRNRTTSSQWYLPYNRWGHSLSEILDTVKRRINPTYDKITNITREDFAQLFTDNK